MSTLLLICCYILGICIFFHPVNSDASQCDCVNKNRCNDEVIKDIIIPRINANECPEGQVCCYYPEGADENDGEGGDGDLIPNNHEDDPEFKDECGIRIVNRHGIANYDRFKDGEAKLGEFPWMVTIIKDNKVQCGGSIISPSVVLTAAHCLEGKQTNSFTIRAGDWDLSKTTEKFKHKSRTISEFVLHENFRKSDLSNDIALIFLNKPFEFSSFINSICIPKLNTNFDQQNCIASGWGKYDLKSNYANILKRVEDLRIIPHDECNDMLKTNTRLPQSFDLHKSFTCAGGVEGKDMCKGDGGGPLMCESEKNPGQYIHVGIVSWGVGCNRHNVPGVYVNVAEFTQWIDDQMVAKGLDGERYYYSAEIENEEGDGVEDLEE